MLMRKEDIQNSPAPFYALTNNTANPFIVLTPCPTKSNIIQAPLLVLQPPIIRPCPDTHAYATHAHRPVHNVVVILVLYQHLKITIDCVRFGRYDVLGSVEQGLKVSW